MSAGYIAFCIIMSYILLLCFIVYIGINLKTNKVMKELSNEDKAKRYDEALHKAKRIINVCVDDNTECRSMIACIQQIFPELKESEDERILKQLRDFFKNHINSVYEEIDDNNDVLTWLEKQGECEFDCPQNHQDVNRPNGCIVLEDFNGGEGFYKVHLDYLNKKQVEEIEEMIRVWNNKELKTPNENIKDCIGICLTDADEQRFKDFNTNLKECLVWLKKQGEQKLPIEKLPSEMKTIGESLGFTTQEDCDIYNKMVTDLIMSDDGKDEQKPAWSEEDETKIKSIIALLKSPALCTMDGNKGIIDESIKYLKSLKYRVQPKQEWSEEDEITRKALINLVEMYYGGCFGKTEKNRLLNFLKSIRPQNRWKPGE